MAYPNKKCTFANRVVRRSKSQNISALALSLNRYHKSATPPFYSDIQSDTRFLIILGKDNKFDVGLISSKFNEFKRAFKDENQKEMPSMTNRGEQLYKRIYNTLVSLYKF